MDILMTILVILLILVIICFPFIFLNNTIYCNIFEREQVQIFNKLNRLSTSDFYRKKGGYEYYTDKYPEYYIITWDNGTTSVHTNYMLVCVASAFYKKGSKKLYEKLKNIE